jgi:hypothetical protein
MLFLSQALQDLRKVKAANSNAITAGVQRASVQTSLKKLIVSIEFELSEFPCPAPCAAYAGHTVLSALFPWRQSQYFDGLLSRQVAAANLTQAEAANSKSIGINAAKKVLAGR